MNFICPSIYNISPGSQDLRLKPSVTRFRLLVLASMAPKRHAKDVMSSHQRQLKKAKKDPLAEKLKQQLGEVYNELLNADLTSDVGKMLDVVLPLSLGEFSDQRHRFQEQVVKGIEGILGEVEASLKHEVAEKKAAKDAADVDKPLRESAAAEAAEKLSTKVAEVHSLKVVLAEKAMGFRAARDALAAAEEAKVVDGEKARGAEKKKSDFLVAAEHMKALKTTAPEDADAKKNHDLMALLKKYKFEESMLIALPAALAKALDARGQFDNMAIHQLETEIDKMIAEQDVTLEAAVPGQQKCEAAIKAAQDSLAAARGAQRAAAKAYDNGSKQQAELTEASAAATKAVKDVNNLSKKAEKNLNNAEVQVELFFQGPHETFKELCQRSTPPPEPEVQPAEEVAAAVPMEEVAVPEVAVETKEVEMPIAA